MKSPRLLAAAGTCTFSSIFLIFWSRYGRFRHRDNKGTATHRRRPAGPPPQGPRSPLRADGRAGGRAFPAGEQLLLQGEDVREVFLPQHQLQLGALRLLHQPRLRLPRRAHEARPPPPRDGPLPHARHRALHEGRAQQDDHGRGRRPLRAHGVPLRLRAREEGQGTREEGQPLFYSVEGPGGHEPIRRPAGIGRQVRHLCPRLPAAPCIGLARRHRPTSHREEPFRVERVIVHPRARREIRDPKRWRSGTASSSPPSAASSRFTSTTSSDVAR